MNLLQLKSLIKSDLARVEDEIQRLLNSEQSKSLHPINAYMLEKAGKRLRPALLLLSFHATRRQADHVALDKAIKIAAGIELIHMASLIHDDIIDKAAIRHDRPSVVAKWGAEIAIPYGVYLYAWSLQQIADVANVEVLSVISKAVRQLCVGELSQVSARDRMDWRVKHYLRMIKQKTGVLFAAACQCGAILADADLTHQRQLRLFGQELGLAYQVMDDYMDIMGLEDELKKKAGQDIELGEFTLPLIKFFQAANPDHQLQMKQALFDTTSSAQQRQVHTLLNHYPNILDESQTMAERYLEKAKCRLKTLPGKSQAKALETIATYILERAKNPTAP